MTATAMPPKSHPPLGLSAPKSSRIDVVFMKKKLLQDLGARADEYWTLLKAFIQSKLTKIEFDEQVPGVLGQENFHRHNEFIYAIIRNAHHPEPPTIVTPLKPRPKKERPDLAILLKELEGPEDDAPLPVNPDGSPDLQAQGSGLNSLEGFALDG
eukprot:CAMPEP_0198205042 /NCGR_PEP_ID=MMETSP1445-20131203/8522_1 /TAXON_ID=36898 /ORGANISM="Pyramimonas sp., Strain CCMP2087" /LENGTH=154 /DNA_ID=CAMNT_0043877183 /DNA_START=50 /DNA_END=511 /DNA_ORIENTATION=+